MDREQLDQRSAEALHGLMTTIVRRVPRDLSLTALATLGTLDRTGPRRITDLAAIEGVAQPSMTNLVSNLERDGLVERRSDPDDGRVALVAVTDAGQAYMRTRRRSGAASLADLIAKLDPEDSAALAQASDALIRLRHADDADREPSRPAASST